MKINDYPYGKITKTLKNAVSWLNRNNIRIIKEYLHTEEYTTHSDLDFYIFDFPDYCGMPKKISYRLNSDEVDWLQDEFENMKFSFKEKYKLSK
jgi:methyl coenzyme M reductase alpha subunit